MPLLTLHRSQTDPLLRKSPQQCPPRSSAVLPLEAVAQLEQSPSVVQSRRNFKYIEMATAKLKSHLHAPHIFRHNSTAYVQAPVDEEQRRKERDFICDYDCHSGPLKPDDITESSGSKEVGCACKNIRVGDFQLLKTIGTGTFARVWLACLADAPKEDQKVFALKILRKTDVIRLKQVEHIKNERNTLAAVAGHPFITTMITSFSDKDCLYMLLDYCPGGELFTYLRRAIHFDENTARFYVAEMVLVLEFLHEHQGIAYRDMKPENMLIDAEGHLKLVDFGFAKKLEQRETYTLCGTPEYLAPEVIKNTGKARHLIGHGEAVDWWSLGILLFEFLVGQPPFWDNQPIKIYEKIVQGHIRYPAGIAPEAKQIIAGLCTANPANRLGYIQQGELGGAALVKAHPFFKSIDWDDLYHRKMKGPIIPKVRSPTDSSNFTEYDAPSSHCSAYTKDMQQKYDHEFKDF